MYFTEKQLRIMQFIQQFRGERGISPTLEEIAENFGVTKITIYEHINQLERKGALKREKFRARSIELLVPVDESPSRFTMPVVGKLRADAPVEKHDESENFDLSDFLPIGKDCVMLRVDGNGMVDEHLTHGDLVILEKRPAARNGDTVVVNLNGKTAIRRLVASDKGMKLVSTNGGGSIDIQGEPRIEGVVIGVVRTYGA